NESSSDRPAGAGDLPVLLLPGRPTAGAGGAGIRPDRHAGPRGPGGDPVPAGAFHGVRELGPDLGRPVDRLQRGSALYAFDDVPEPVRSPFAAADLLHRDAPRSGGGRPPEEIHRPVPPPDPVAVLPGLGEIP